MKSGRAIVLLQSELDAFLGSPTPTPSVSQNTPIHEGFSSTGNFMQLVGLVLLLIVILVGAYFTTKIVGGIKLQQLHNSNFHLIDSYRISPNKILQLVKIGNKFVVIAIGKDTMNVITELDEKEVIIRETGGAELPNFKQILDKLKKNNE